MKHIKFLENYMPHAKGEIASFEDALADKFINAGIAIEHTFEEVANATKGTGKKTTEKVGE